jgi:predicted nucleic acid-binding protein
LEAEAVVGVLHRIEIGEIKLVVSSALLAENAHDSSPQRRRRSQRVLDLAAVYVEFDEADARRAEMLYGLGFGKADALHIVAAEKANCDALLTTDDQLIRNAVRHNKLLLVPVINPVVWAMES